MIWKSLDCLRQMKRVFLDKCPEAKCREKPRDLKSGLEPTAPKALGQKSGTKIKVVFQDSVVQHQ